MADAYPKELSVLATGSLTNLWGAYEMDSAFFENVKEIVLMGGITSPLVFEKKVMDELNFSCDPHASWTVLTKGRNVSVITGNNCLKVLFTKEEYKNRLFGTENPAAVYLMRPELFVDERKEFRISEHDLRTGYLHEAQNGNCILNLPAIGEETAFKNEIYEAWMRVPVKRR